MHLQQISLQAVPARLAVLFFLAVASGQPATVFTDGTFTPADWQSATFVAQGTTSMAFDQVAAGNPEPGRRMTFSVTSVDAGATVINRSGAVNVVFSYDPSVQGAIQGIVVSFDLAVLTSTFPGARSGGYTPMLMQGGIAYAMSGGASAGSTAWVGFTRSSTDASQWVGGGFNPDFSASGGVIRFGYQTTFTLSCDLQVNCGPATVTSALDNYRVAIESVPVTNAGIPEPSTLALSGGALLLVAVGSGRRSASPTDRTTS